MDLFDRKEVNTGRQPEIDLCKAVVIFFLATIHVYVESSTDQQLFHGLPYFFDSIVGGPWAAPMFLFSMGVGFAYTYKNTAKDLAKRGVSIGLLGLGLNVCRFLIPSIVGYLITGDKAMYLDRLPYRFFGNDLLQFAALGFLLMALLRYLELTPVQMWLVSIVMNFVAMVFNNIAFDNMALNIILGHFIGIDDGTEIIVSDFPLMIWFLFYTSGYLAGIWLRRLKDKKRFYMIVSPICLAVSIIVYVIEYINGFGMMGGPGANVFYHMATWELFLCIATNIGMIGVYYLIVSFLPARVICAIERLSRLVTVVYVIQWTLVWWACNVIIYIIRGDKYLESWQSLILGLSLSTVSVILGNLWGWFRRNLREKKEAAA